MAIDPPSNQKINIKTDIKTLPQVISGRADAQVQTHSPQKVETTLESINIKVGQAMQAKVLDVLDAVTTKSGQAQFNVSLEIAGKTVLVKTNIQLQPGQLIEIKVNDKGELILPKPVAQDINNLIKAISKALPFQQPVGKVIAQLLHNLPLLAKDNNEVKVLAEQIAQILPKSDNLKPSQAVNSASPVNEPLKLIKQAMERSGVFMENTLASRGSTTGTSMASALANEQTSKALIAALNASISKNTTNSRVTAAGSDLAPPATGTHTTLALSNTTATQSMSPQTTTEIPDLKAAISQSISLLNNMNTDANGKPLTRPLAEADLNLLVNPFDFPSQLNSAISSAVRNKEDLSVGDLLKLLAGALNRIQFNQLNSLYQSQSSSPDSPLIQTWQMEIPFINQQKEIDPIQLRVDQEDANKDEQSETEKKSKWKITLAFDFEGLGPLVVQINLMPPQISSTIWAEQKETLKMVNNEAKKLRESLTNIGLEVDSINCLHGQPNLKKTRLDQQIVDIKA